MIATGWELDREGAGAYRLSPPRVQVLCRSRSLGGAIVRLLEKRGLSCSYVLSEARALERLRGLPFDLLLIDVPEGPAAPFGGWAKLLKGGSVPVLVLTPSLGPPAIGEGKVFVLRKPVSWDRVLRSIDAIVAGGHLPDPLGAVRSQSGDTPRGLPAGGKALSPREVEVLNHMVDGYANKAIARELEISEPTVKKHVQRIVSKLNAAGRAQAAAIAVRAGLVT